MDEAERALIDELSAQGVDAIRELVRSQPDFDLAMRFLGDTPETREALIAAVHADVDFRHDFDDTTDTGPAIPLPRIACMVRAVLDVADDLRGCPHPKDRTEQVYLSIAPNTSEHRPATMCARCGRIFEGL